MKRKLKYPISELLKPLGEKKWKGNVYGARFDGQIIMNVEKEVGPSPSPSVTPSVTPTQSVTPSVTSSITPTPSSSFIPSVTPTPTPSITPSESITPTPSVTSSITPTPTPTPSSTPIVFETEYQNILNYAIANSYPLPSYSQQLLQNTLVKDLKDNSIWSRLDLFYVFAQNSGNQNFGSLNWKNPSATYQIGFINSPIFDSNQGMRGDGVSAYLTTGFSPAINGTGFTQNDCSRFSWVYTGSTDANKAIDVDSTATALDYMAIANAVGHRISSSNGLNSAFDNTGIGNLKLISRTTSTNVLLRNGSTTATRTQTSTNLGGGITLLGRATGLNGNVGISIYGLGASMNTFDATLNTILTNYISSI
jgi:hypothetical protein